MKVILNVREKVGLFLKSNKRIYFFFLVFILFSCTGEPPQVLESWWQLNLLLEDSDKDPVESLSLFIHAQDEDGEEDLDQIYLINDDEYTVWNIPSDLWLTHIERGVTWIGFNGLRAPGDGRFSDGNYRILLVDLGGERAESSFYLRNSIPEAEELILPEITFNNREITIESDFPKFEIWFYDEEGNVLEKSKSLLMGRYQWDTIVRNIVRRSASFSLYTEPENGSWGVISGPYDFID